MVTADEFNEAVPVGSLVRIRLSCGTWLLTRTRSRAWTLASGHPVVATQAFAGGWSIRPEHMELVRDEADS